MVVVCGVLFTLLGAAVADNRAHPADLRYVLPAANHHSHRHLTCFGAVAIQADAAGKLFHVLLVDAGIRAHFTGNPALHARLDAPVMLFLRLTQVLA